MACWSAKFNILWDFCCLEILCPSCRGCITCVAHCWWYCAVEHHGTLLFFRQWAIQTSSMMDWIFPFVLYLLESDCSGNFFHVVLSSSRWLDDSEKCTRFGSSASISARSWSILMWCCWAGSSTWPVSGVCCRFICIQFHILFIARLDSVQLFTLFFTTADPVPSYSKFFFVYQEGHFDLFTSNFKQSGSSWYPICTQFLQRRFSFLTFI